MNMQTTTNNFCLSYKSFLFVGILEDFTLLILNQNQGLEYISLRAMESLWVCDLVATYVFLGWSDHKRAATNLYNL